MTFIHPDPLAHRDVKFIHVLYDTPVGTLLEMDKAYLQRYLARTQLICQWLEGILELMAAFETKGEQ